MTPDRTSRAKRKIRFYFHAGRGTWHGSCYGKSRANSDFIFAQGANKASFGTVHAGQVPCHVRPWHGTCFDGLARNVPGKLRAGRNYRFHTVFALAVIEWAGLSSEKL